MNESKKIELVLTEEQASIVSQALEAFSRATMGQFRYALEGMFPHIHFGYDDGYALEFLIRDRINCIARDKGKESYFPKEPNASWGVYNKQCGNGTAAYHIHQVIRQYKHVTRNDGYFDHSRDSDDAFTRDTEEVAYIKGFVKYKDFDLYDFSQRGFKKFDELFKAGKFDEIWPIVDKFKHPKGELSKIMSEPFMDSDDVYRYFLRVTKPRKPDEAIQS